MIVYWAYLGRVGGGVGLKLGGRGGGAAWGPVEQEVQNAGDTWYITSNSDYMG